ncbi:MAG: Ig-like domain-containing protein [Holophagales bacterium]|jgi:hypothetical protein|nr:Ig-like domain-containing protein [Holophagales bacterium]
MKLQSNLLAILLLALSLLSCSGGADKTIHVTDITVEPTTMTIPLGEYRGVNVIFHPNNADNQRGQVTSSDLNAAVPSLRYPPHLWGGIYCEGINLGTATITFTTEDGGKQATCVVTVIRQVTGLDISETALTLFAGETHTLTATAQPENATNKNVIWDTSDETVATVTGTGNTVTINGIKAGTAKITVATEDGGKQASCTVTVLSKLISGDVVVFSKDPMTLWINGEIANGITGRRDIINCMFVANKNLYLAGYETIIDEKGRKEVATIWKNGVPQYLSHGNSDTTSSRIASIFVTDDDVVYAAGHEYATGTDFYKPRDPIAMIWKNGVPQRLTEGNNDTVISSIFVSGNDVYVGGSYFYDNASRSNLATVWKNGIQECVAESLQDSYWGYLGADMRQSSVSSVFISNNKVYLSGSENYSINPIAVLWTDGNRTRLTAPPFTNSSSSSAASVYVSDNNVYVAGSERNGNTGVTHAMLWKNGVPQQLSIGDYGGVARSVFVSGNDVYVTGRQLQNSGTLATLWVNGVPQYLYGSWELDSIFVVK